jgi:hypothetical protein
MSGKYQQSRALQLSSDSILALLLLAWLLLAWLLLQVAHAC